MRPPELIDRAQELRADGKTQGEIAQELKISLGAVNKYLKRDSVHAVNTVNRVNTMDRVGIGEQLPDVLVIPASVPNDEESIAACYERQR